MNNEKRFNLAKTMFDIVENNVKHYKSDFLYDYDFMLNCKDKKFIWIARNCGTNLIRLWPADFNIDTVYNAKLALKSFIETNKETTIKHKFFIVDFENYTISELSARAAADYLK